MKKMKKILLNLILMLVTALVTAFMVLAGAQHLNKQKDGGAVTSLFTLSTSVKEKDLQFVEIKNLVITLKSNSVKERYLLLDLALTTHDKLHTQSAENMLPKIKGITVDVLSSMSYDEVRGMTVLELRSMMMEHYQSVFKNINVTIPFEDVTISKMVFQ